MQRLGLLTLPLLCTLGCEAPVQGELQLTSNRGHALTFAPTACVDGNERGFFGVELEDDHHQLLDFHRRADGPSVLFFAPGITAFELDDSNCEHLRGELERNFNRVTDNGKVSGTLDLSCRSRNGWTIDGTVTFEECHAPNDNEDCDDDY